MKKRLIFGCFFLTTLGAQAQSLKFKLKEHIILPKERGIHDISGIEFIPAKQEWHLVSDRGRYYIFRHIQKLTDFLNPEDTAFTSDMRFESVRYDSLTDSHFYAVEYNKRTFAGFQKGRLPRLENQVRKIDSLISLPADNKGIEAVAVTPTTVWIAPEAGRPGEASLSNSIVHFHRYARKNDKLSDKVLYTYTIDRHPDLQNSRYTTENLGGISEILSVNDNQLLVLEKHYDERRDQVFAKLYVALIDEPKKQLSKTELFDFTKQANGLRIDNLEGMTWGQKQKNGKRTLVLVSDDNGGKCPRDDGGQCQVTQIFVLEEQ